MTQTRRAALLRLLEDWEAGRMTPGEPSNRVSVAGWLRLESLVAWNDRPPGIRYTLTPAGVAAARRTRKEG